MGPAAINRPNPGMASISDASKPTERTANNRAGGSAGRRAFGRLGALFKSEVFRALVEGKENRNVRVTKTLAFHFIHCGLHLCFGIKNSENYRVRHLI